MKRFVMTHALTLAVACSTVGEAAPTPTIRTANARARQVDPGVPAPLPPAPMPDDPMPVPPAGLAPAPAPIRNPGAYSSQIPRTPTPLDAVPSPDSGPMYSQPFGTIRERTPPQKEYFGDPDGQGSYHPPSNAQSPSPHTLPALSPHAPQAEADRFGVAPPPGTLGHTYHRRSRVLDEKKHPRVGVVEVHLSENYDVTAKGLKSKWNGKIWELESDPLLPGVPHIFQVVAEWGPANARQREVRTVRLIMGRAVDLEF